MDRRPNKNNKSRARKSGHKKSKREDLKLHIEFQGQAKFQQWLAIAPIPIVTTVTTGVVSISQALETIFIPNFSTRFSAFQEARVIGSRVKVLLFSSTNPGVLNHWYESGVDTTAPTSDNAMNQIVKRFNSADILGTHGLRYTPSDPLELTWQPVSDAGTIAGNYNFYTDAANYGAPIVVTVLGQIQLDLLVQMRGLI